MQRKLLWFSYDYDFYWKQLLIFYLFFLFTSPLPIFKIHYDWFSSMSICEIIKLGCEWGQARGAEDKPLYEGVILWILCCVCCYVISWRNSKQGAEQEPDVMCACTTHNYNEKTSSIINQPLSFRELWNPLSYAL